MAIILMRHGKPENLSDCWLPVQAMKQWSEAYDLSQVGGTPPERSRYIAATADYIVASPLPRACSSLEKLGVKATCTDAVFREVSLPLMQLSYPPLPPSFWLSLLRILWFFGYAGSVESYQQAKCRAIQAAARLIALSSHGNVLLVGHGIMNKMIARQLRKEGWLAEKHASSRYWSTAIYHPPFIP
ncbi:histidine phosphatase family protein [Erwinia psidii]|uniref:Histidine phosphatase family protein n=1 Tax=Erwinia psidii TaxID=69224 RepID=A0A3N6ULY1_9GAMM|nr:histidine phosphatase family protein [Erwinia psidii]MCX8959432.1 histidine phosphatase family protein [Erwinia psidii]MCX8964284.1 histidine phosphatase family protein [Erwinia psidii]RQM36929.1 histidine phosphatase family protein [Erwinia psidii]